MTRCRILSLPAAALASVLCLSGCGGDDPSVPPAPAGWQETYGGVSLDYAQSVKQTSDGGYIIAGRQIHPLADATAAFLLKLDAAGDTLWSRIIDAPPGVAGKSVMQTADGGYLLLADYGPTTFSPNRQFWLIKTDGAGNTVWDVLKGYNDCQEEPSEVQPTSDGGYIVIGTTDRGGHDHDIWLVKTGPGGETHWYAEKGYDDANEYGGSIQQTTDGGYLLAGTTYRGSDGRIWLVKLFANGSTHWFKTLPTTVATTAVAIRRTADGAYVVMGYVRGGNHQLIQLFKYDETGNQLWATPNEGWGYYWGAELQETADGGLIVAGSRQKAEDDTADFCLVRFGATGTTLWERTFDLADDWCNSGRQTADGGYVLCGFTRRPGVAWDTDVLLIKTDANGDVD